MQRIRSAALVTVSMLLVAVMAAGCGSDSKKNPAGSGGADVTIQIVAIDGANSFSPNPATVTVGQTVAWHNTLSVTHTATANGGAFNTGNISPGSTSSPVTMSTAGSFPYHCNIHTSMVGTLQVNP